VRSDELGRFRPKRNYLEFFLEYLDQVPASAIANILWIVSIYTAGSLTSRNDRATAAHDNRADEYKE
jgi:hypothetical protein